MSCQLKKRCPNCGELITRFSSSEWLCQNCDVWFPKFISIDKQRKIIRKIMIEGYD